MIATNLCSFKIFQSFPSLKILSIELKKVKIQIPQQEEAREDEEGPHLKDLEEMKMKQKLMARISK